MKGYIFYRKEGFYPVEYKTDEDAIKGAELNLGTLKVENENGVIIWQLN